MFGIEDKQIFSLRILIVIVLTKKTGADKVGFSRSRFKKNQKLELASQFIPIYEEVHCNMQFSSKIGCHSPTESFWYIHLTVHKHSKSRHS